MYEQLVALLPPFLKAKREYSVFLQVCTLDSIRSQKKEKFRGKKAITIRYDFDISAWGTQFRKIEKSIKCGNLY